MSGHRLSRRAWLSAMGMTAALVPLLEPKTARTAQAGSPKRLVVVVSPNGVLDDRWWPSGTETDFTFPDMTQDLEPLKSDLIVLSGVQLKCFMDDKPRAFGNEAPSAGGSHDNYPALLTGKALLRYAASDKMGDGPSIDQYVADGLIAAGIKTPFRSLNLGAKTQTGASDQLIFRASNQPVTPENDPTKVFSSLFAGRNLDSSALQKLLADRKSVLDFVSRDLASFGKNLGTDDRQKVEAHLQTIRELEGQLSASQPACAPPSSSALDMSNLPKQIKSQMDLAATALACDLTRVIVVQMTDHNGTVATDFLGGTYADPSASGDFGRIHNTHEIAHHAHDNPQQADLKVGVERFFLQQLAYFIQKLKAVPEGGGNLLDNTAVFYINNAHDGGAHSSDKMPILLAGSCGGAFKTGRNLVYPKVPHNGVLIALANAMGVPTQTFGDPQYGGEIASLRTA